MVRVNILLWFLILTVRAFILSFLSMTLVVVFFVVVAQHGMQDLRSPTMDLTLAACSESMES